MTSLPLRALNLIFFPIELILATLLFVKQLQRRKFWWLWLSGGIAASVGACFLLPWLKDVLMASADIDVFSYKLFWVSYVLTVLEDLLLVVLYEFVVFAVFKSDALNVVYICCASFLTQNVSRCLFVIFIFACGASDVSLVSALSSPLNVAAYIVIYIAVYTACYFVFARKYEIVDNNSLFKKILIPMVLIMLINLLMNSVNAPKDNSEAQVLYIYILIGRIVLCCTGLAVQFLILNWYKMQLSQSLLQQIMDRQKEQFQLAKESVDTVNVNAHDLKNQINVILNAVRESGQNGDLKDKLDEMMKSITVLDTNYQTGNTALDVTFTEKSRICRQKGIKLSIIADGKLLSFMSDIDIYALFGNALDNAIEATENIEDDGNKIISLSVRKENGMVCVHSENTFEKEPEFVDGVPLSNKSNSRFHGFGTKSIINIVKKYGGNVTMRAENEIFYLDAIFLSK